MDAATEKLCLDEMSHFICDEDAKVTLKEVSNNWNVSLKDSEIVLNKWLSTYKGDRRIVKEYLIRGTDLNGNCVISVVPERKLEALESLCPKYCSSLYSLELASNAGRRLNVTNATETKIINLPLESAKRDVKVHVLPVPGRKCEIKPEPSTSSAAAAKKPSSFFGVNQATKKEKTSPDVKPASTNGAFAEEAATPIAVKVEKKSPVKKESPKKAKIASGRSAISSFFSSKPAAKPSASGRERAEEVKTKNDVFVKKETQMETVESTQVASNKKRTLSETNSTDSEGITAGPEKEPEPTKKKVKTEKAKSKPASNRSRILQICDSSSDEEDSQTNKPDFAVEDVAMKEKENTTPEKNQNDDEVNGLANESVPKKRRYKAKKTFKRTYEDADGYMRTVCETVEFSCSEDESAGTQLTSPSEKEIKQPEASAGNKNKKKISPPKNQKSILTFFSKK